MKKLFNINAHYSECKRINGNSARLRITRKDIFKALISKGLISGDKVKNQIGVPDWIKNSEKFNISSLRGLLDTDGSIASVAMFKTITLSFSNASLPLVKDFKEMCNRLFIHTSKIIGPIKKVSKISGKVSKLYVVSIQAKDQVKKFIEIVQPKKWDYHGKEILNRIGKSFEETFNYIESPYNLSKALEWKNLIEKVGSIKKLIKYLNEHNQFTPTEKSFKIWVEKLLGKRSYKIWLKFNSNLLINERGDKIQQFPQHLRRYLCVLVYEILNNYEYSSENDIFNVLITKINNSELLGRLNYLLNNLNTRTIIRNYLLMLIGFVREIKVDTEIKKRVNMLKIKKELNLPIHPSHIKEIVRDIKDKFD